MTMETSVARRPSLLVSGIANWLPMTVQFVISLLLVPVLIRHLGKEDYGIWVLANSFLGYYGLLRMGVDTSIMRFLPFYAGRHDHKAVSQVVNTAMGMFGVIGLLILGTSIVAAGPIARFYGGGRPLALLVILTGLAAALECPYRVLDATLRAEEKWGVANLISTSAGLLRAGLILACVWLGYRLIGIGYVTIAVTLGTLGMAVILFLKGSKAIRLGVSMFSWSRLPEMLSFGALTTVTTLAYGLVLQGHKLIIGKLVSLEAVCVYAIAAMLVERLRQAVWTPFQVSWPRFALLHGEQDHHKLSDLFENGTHYCSQLSSFLVVLMLLLGPPFIRLWVGAGFEMAQRVLVILGVGVLVETSTFMSSSFLAATGRQRAQALFALIEALLGLGLSLWLGWRLGVPGVAWGYTISVVLIRGVAVTFYVCSLLHLNPTTLFRRSFASAWCLAGLVAGLGYVLHVPAGVQGWLSFVVASMLTSAVTGGGMYVFVMTAEEKSKISYLVRRLGLLTA